MTLTYRVCTLADKGPSKDSGTPAEQQFVRSVIELHDKYLQYVNTCFCNSSLFHKALKEAFEAFCNKTVAGSASAELMASFCDNLLKKVRRVQCYWNCTASSNVQLECKHQGCLDEHSWPLLLCVSMHGHHNADPGRGSDTFHMTWLQGGSEKLSDEAIEETLDKVVKLLAYISDKDMFAEFYRKKLARRLLHDKSSSDDHERSILSRLKQQCGAQFTSKVGATLALTCSISHNFEDVASSQWNVHGFVVSISQ